MVLSLLSRQIFASLGSPELQAGVVFWQHGWQMNNGVKKSPVPLGGKKTLASGGKSLAASERFAILRRMTETTRSYTLDPGRVTATIEQLYDRIRDRFPESGLSKVCQQLASISQAAQRRGEYIRSPKWGIRLAALLLSIAIIGLVASTIVAFGAPKRDLGLLDFVGLLDSGLNDIVFIGAAIVFLVTWEMRIKRNRALESLHELRSIAHLIDMHQLTKDPERLHHPGQETPHSPRSEMTRFELNRYLDYCSEMLSLTGKVAALYVQDFNDAIAVGAVNDIENLTTGLSRKIWQKIMILRMDEKE